jgi:hypothetical protein
MFLPLKLIGFPEVPAESSDNIHWYNTGFMGINLHWQLDKFCSGLQQYRATSSAQQPQPKTENLKHAAVRVPLTSGPHNQILLLAVSQGVYIRGGGRLKMVGL